MCLCVFLFSVNRTDVSFYTEVGEQEPKRENSRGAQKA